MLLLFVVFPGHSCLFLISNIYRFNWESPAQFENLIKPQVYVRRIKCSTMYKKAPFCYFVNRVNEVYVIEIFF